MSHKDRVLSIFPSELVHMCCFACLGQLAHTSSVHVIGSIPGPSRERKLEISAFQSRHTGADSFPPPTLLSAYTIHTQRGTT